MVIYGIYFIKVDLSALVLMTFIDRLVLWTVVRSRTIGNPADEHLG